VRLDVVPALLAAISTSREPSAASRAALARRVAATAEDARAGARVVGRLAARALARRASGSADATSIDVRGWARLPVAVRHSILARLWQTAAPRSSGLPRRHRDALDALLARGRRVADLAMPGGGRARLSGGVLSMSEVAPGPAAKALVPAGRKPRASNGPADARLRPTSARRARSGPARSHARAGIANRRRIRPTTVSR